MRWQKAPKATYDDDGDGDGDDDDEGRRSSAAADANAEAEAAAEADVVEWLGLVVGDCVWVLIKAAGSARANITKRRSA